ncbi:MAG: hypothetical protein EOM40_04445 [Clostridia bacterium]|nr:hypothetical protein [Clostridia bacterium]NCC44997.1 hypothetical protein [Clostridia bacterium]
MKKKIMLGAFLVISLMCTACSGNAKSTVVSETVATEKPSSDQEKTNKKEESDQQKPDKKGNAKEPEMDDQPEAQLELNDMSSYEEDLNEEIEWNEEKLGESASWIESAQAITETDYAWVSEAKDVLIQYFADTYQQDISGKVNAIETYAADMDEVLYGFSDGTGKVYFNRNDIESDDMFHVCIHEMIHALGIDFYEDKSGLMSNAFFEGYTEKLTEIILTKYGYPYEEVSSYGDLTTYAQTILECDESLLTDIVIEEKYDIAGRIDRILGEGAGENLLKAEMLIAIGVEAPEIGENCNTIISAYKEALSSTLADDVDK